MELAAYIVLTVLALVSAGVVVWHRNPVVCALALAFNLVTIAGFYMLLNAQFLALLQIIVYAGAIMVLILFVIMLLNLPEEARRPGSGRIQGGLGFILAVAFAAVVGVMLARSVGEASFETISPEFGTVNALGLELFSRFFYPFEAISLLLVVAMVGAVLLAKRRL
jgi:NADH-quinone oxidoreductase subunit J